MSKKLERQIEALTRRLVTCSLDDFHKVQAELFSLQNKLKAKKDQQKGKENVQRANS